MTSLTTGNGPRLLKDVGLDAQRVPFDKLPVIDLAPIFGEDEDARRDLALALRRACSEVGFFYVKNHGVPQPVIDAAFATARRFFDQPDEEKMKIHVAKSRNNRGYAALLEENTDPTARGDLHESWDMALEVPADDPDVLAGKTLYGPNQWPEGDEAFRRDVNAYYDEMLRVSHALLHAFALSLELEETHFDPLVEKRWRRCGCCTIRRSRATWTSARSASARIRITSASPSLRRTTSARCRC